MTLTRLLTIFLLSNVLISCAAPYQVSGWMAIVYEDEAVSRITSSQAVAEQYEAILSNYLRKSRHKLPLSEWEKRDWKYGEGTSGTVDGYEQAINRARNADPSMHLQQFIAPAISPVIYDEESYPAWTPKGIELQFLGYGDVVKAVLIKNPLKNTVYFVPAPTAVSVLSAKYCIGRPFGDPVYKKCDKCGADLIAQPFELVEGFAYFAPNESEEHRTLHKEKDGTTSRHLSGKALSENCDIRKGSPGAVCAEPGTTGAVAQ